MSQKKEDWNTKWGKEDFNPPWKLNKIPPVIRALIDNKTIPTGASLLDIGCGSGFLAAKLAEENFQVTGFDFADTAIAKAKASYKETPKLSFTVADATVALPFSRKFDVGIDRGTFHKLPFKSHRDYAKYISPVIEAGGKLVIIFEKQIANRLTESYKDNPGEALKHHLEKLFGEQFYVGDFEEHLIETHNDDEMPGYIIILTKK